MRDPILYLSTDDIAGLELGTAEILDAVDGVLQQKSVGRTFLEPKLTMAVGKNANVAALVGAAEEPALSVVKWVAVNGGNPGRGLPQINALIVLNDAETGMVRTVMSGNWVTGARTAACSAVAARHLARLDACTVGFAGCGLQAHTHLDALLHVLPELRHVYLLGRSEGPVTALADAVAARGLTVQVARSPAELVGVADVVVSSVPPSAELLPFLDPASLRVGAFVSAVDLGRPWLRAGWRDRFDVIATDDVAQSELLASAGKMIYGGPFDAEIGDLSVGKHPGRTDARQRTCLVFGGMALADLGLTALVDRTARARGAGRFLPA